MMNQLNSGVIRFVLRYIYLILLILVIALLWRPLGPLGIIIAYAVGVAVISGVRRIWRHR